MVSRYGEVVIPVNLNNQQSIPSGVGRPPISPPSRNSLPGKIQSQIPILSPTVRLPVAVPPVKVVTYQFFCARQCPPRTTGDCSKTAEIIASLTT